ncbi:hypothetical protein [Runella sp.]|uniref:hypothetical protein n=1 Tax=Runella sp. TaxID=1960881 RepID=UPI002605F0E0|nr:hypothetical protein [Runella sp.]
MKKIVYLLPLAFFSIALFTLTFAQSVNLTKSVYAPGERIVVNFSGFSGNAKDWISIAQPGSADDKYIVWEYINGSRSGSVSFNGLPYANYEIRGYYNNESTVRARASFKVGNADQNLSVSLSKSVYPPNERIVVNFSGFSGNAKDWISIAQPGSADDKYILWQYTNGKQSGTVDFAGLPEGNYEVRSYFNNESVIKSRYAFTVGKASPTTGKTGRSGRFCNKELSLFYSGVYGLGLCWGRLGSDVIAPGTITDVQATLTTTITALNTITCLDFDVQKISSYSARLPGMSRVQAVNEIDLLIKEILGSIQRANISCDNGAGLTSLYLIGIHLGASQAICNTFVCRAIPMDWQTNLRNHLSLVSRGISEYSACIPGVSPSLVSTVAVGSPNAYIPFSTIVAIHIQVLWSVSLSTCCCSCK